MKAAEPITETPVVGSEAPAGEEAKVEEDPALTVPEPVVEAQSEEVVAQGPEIVKERKEVAEPVLEVNPLFDALGDHSSSLQKKVTEPIVEESTVERDIPAAEEAKVEEVPAPITEDTAPEPVIEARSQAVVAQASEVTEEPNVDVEPASEVKSNFFFLLYLSNLFTTLQEKAVEPVAETPAIANEVPAAEEAEVPVPTTEEILVPEPAVEAQSDEVVAQAPAVTEEHKAEAEPVLADEVKAIFKP